MRRHPYPNAPPDGALQAAPSHLGQPGKSAALHTTALVLTLFGILASIEAIGWVTTSALFILAAVACISGLVLRYAKKN